MVGLSLDWKCFLPLVLIGIYFNKTERVEFYNFEKIVETCQYFAWNFSKYFLPYGKIPLILSQTSTTFILVYNKIVFKYLVSILLQSFCDL